jgi:Transposase domain (DUF772)
VLFRVEESIVKEADEGAQSDGAAQTGSSDHIDQRIETKQIDLAAHEIGDAGLRHAKQLGGLRLAYASGLYSSRRIAKACRERNDFVMIVALDPPDFRTISDFRKRHLKALGALFLQVLKLCETAGAGQTRPRRA